MCLLFRLAKFFFCLIYSWILKIFYDTNNLTNLNVSLINQKKNYTLKKNKNKKYFSKLILNKFYHLIVLLLWKGSDFL